MEGHNEAVRQNMQPRLWRRRWVKIVAVIAVIALACAVIERLLQSDDQPKAASANHGASSPSEHMVPPARQGTKAGEDACSFSVPLAGATFTVPAGKRAAISLPANGSRSCIPKAQALARIMPPLAKTSPSWASTSIPPTPNPSSDAGSEEVGNPPFEFALDSNSAFVDKDGKVVYHSSGAADEAVSNGLRQSGSRMTASTTRERVSLTD